MAGQNWVWLVTTGYGWSQPVMAGHNRLWLVTTGFPLFTA
jgi:hypothetical protein